MGHPPHRTPCIFQRLFRGPKPRTPHNGTSREGYQNPKPWPPSIGLTDSPPPSPHGRLPPPFTTLVLVRLRGGETRPTSRKQDLYRGPTPKNSSGELQQASVYAFQLVRTSSLAPCSDCSMRKNKTDQRGPAGFTPSKSTARTRAFLPPSQPHLQTPNPHRPLWSRIWASLLAPDV